MRRTLPGAAARAASIVVLLLLLGSLHAVADGPSPDGTLPSTARTAAVGPGGGSGDPPLSRAAVDATEVWRSPPIFGVPLMVDTWDVDGDGATEIVIIGSSLSFGFSSCAGWCWFQKAYIFDGTTQALEFESPLNAGWIGNVGFFDSATSPGQVLVMMDYDWTNNSGRYRVYDTATRLERFATPGYATSAFGTGIVSDSDADGDDDLVFSVSLGAATYLHVYDLGSGTLRGNVSVPSGARLHAVEQMDATPAEEILVVAQASGLPPRIDFLDGATLGVTRAATLGEDPWWIEQVDLDPDGMKDLLTVGHNASQGAYVMTKWDGASRAIGWTQAVWSSDHVIIDIINPPGPQVYTIADNGTFVQLDGGTGAVGFGLTVAGGVNRFQIGDLDLDGSANELLLLGSNMTGIWASLYRIIPGSTPVWEDMPAGQAGWFGPPVPGHEPRAAVLPADLGLDGSLELVGLTEGAGLDPGDSSLTYRLFGLDSATGAYESSTEKVTEPIGCGGFCWNPERTHDVVDLDGKGWWVVLSTINANGEMGFGGWDGPGLDRFWTFETGGRGEIFARDLGSDGWKEVVAVWQNASGSYVSLFEFGPSVRLVTPVPALMVQEDGSAGGVVDLATHFAPGTPGPMTYSIEFEENTSLVQATLRGALVDLATVTPNATGSAFLRVAATDSRGASRSSNDILVTVTPVNDAPVPRPVPDQSLVEGTAFSLQLFADDAEDDPLTWASDHPLFPIGLATGRLDLTPDDPLVGIHVVLFTARDPAGANGSVRVRFTVANVNDPPSLFGLLDRWATEDQPFLADLAAADADAGTAFLWSDESALVDIATLPNGTGRIAFTPDNDDVGVHEFVVAVTDGDGGAARGAFTLTVVNANDAPTIEPIPAQVAEEDTAWRVPILYHDDDLTHGDELRLEVLGDGPSLSIDRRALEWTPTNDDVGVHEIMVAVTDRAGASATVVFVITVRNVNDAPIGLRILRPADGAVLTGARTTFEGVAQDPDGGDELTYEWLEGATVLANGSTADIALAPGSHRIILRVRDRGGATLETAITVVVPSPPVPAKPRVSREAAPWWLLVVLLVAACIAAALVLRRRQGRPPARPFPEPTPAPPADGYMTPPSGGAPGGPPW